MRKNFDPKSLSWLVWILAAWLAVKVLWVIAEWMIPLPVSGVEHKSNTIRHSLHYRYRLASDARIKTPVTPSHKPKAVPRTTLSSYRLVGIYSTKTSAIVTLMRGGKSHILSTGENGGTVAGYHLKDANATAARFQKGETITTLHLYEKKPPSVAAPQAIRRAVTPPKPQKAKHKSPPIEDDGGTKRIDRSLIQEYAQNPEKIWKNIGLYEVKSEGKLDGFKVRFVRRGTPFEKLGLKRGDIIKAINGEPIVDYATPMRMLKSADAIDDLSLTIERNHEEQELRYEVK